MTTLLKSDGSYTSNLNETVQAMLDHLITRDDRTDDSGYHKRIRTKIREPSQAADDREFTPAEIKNAIEELKIKKATGEDGITGEIYKRVYQLFPSFTYTIHGTQCMPASRMIPQEMEKSQNNTSSQARQRKSTGRVQIQTNKPYKCGRQSPRKTTN